RSLHRDADAGDQANRVALRVPFRDSEGDDHLPLPLPGVPQRVRDRRPTAQHPILLCALPAAAALALQATAIATAVTGTKASGLAFHKRSRTPCFFSRQIACGVEMALRPVVPAV